MNSAKAETDSHPEPSHPSYPAPQLAASVNSAKAEIDRCIAGVDAKTAERAAAGPADGDTLIIDEEEYAFIQARFLPSSAHTFTPSHAQHPMRTRPTHTRPFTPQGMREVSWAEARLFTTALYRNGA